MLKNLKLYLKEKYNTSTLAGLLVKPLSSDSKKLLNSLDATACLLVRRQLILRLIVLSLSFHPLP